MSKTFVLVLQTTAASSVTSHSGTGQRSHMGSLAGGASLTSNNSFGSTNTTSSSVLSGCSLRVLIPPETRGSRNGGGSILSKSFPLKPNMTVREVTRMIAGRTRLAANPEDYALYLLEGGKGERLYFILPLYFLPINNLVLSLAYSDKSYRKRTTFLSSRYPFQLFL